MRGQSNAISELSTECRIIWTAISLRHRDRQNSAIATVELDVLIADGHDILPCKWFAWFRPWWSWFHINRRTGRAVLRFHQFAKRRRSLWIARQRINHPLCEFTEQPVLA